MSTQSYVEVVSKDDREEAAFFAHVGMGAAIWGVGSALLLFRMFSLGMFLTPLLLFIAPIALLSFYFSLFSLNSQKRQDSSHILVLSVAGVFACLRESTDWSYYVLAGVLAAVAIRNRRTELVTAPNGPAFCFAVLLLPSPNATAPAVVLVVVSLAIATVLGRSEKWVAASVFALASTLAVTADIVPLSRPWAGALAVAQICVIYYLQASRSKNSPMPFERRLSLDDILVLFALFIFFRAWTMLNASTCYALASASLLSIAVVLKGSEYVVRVISKMDNVSRRRLSLVRFNLRRQNVEWRQNSLIVAAAIAAQMAAYRFDARRVLSSDNVQTAVALCIALLLHIYARRTNSKLASDVAKLSSAFAAIRAAFIINSDTYLEAPVAAALGMALIEFLAIAQTNYISAGDLDKKHAGVWQGIFDGRMLVRLRRTRARVFEMISKAPMIGWLFHMVDKTATNLQKSFGKSKTWSTSHYAICLSTAAGFSAITQILADFLMRRYPSIGGFFWGEDKFALDPLSQLAMANTTAVAMYGTALFAAGALFKKKYLRTLALPLTAVIILAFWFRSFDNKEAKLSAWAFPLAFFCVLTIFRLTFRNREHDGVKQTEQPSASGASPGPSSHVKR